MMTALLKSVDWDGIQVQVRDLGGNAKEMWEQGRKTGEGRSTSKFVSSAKIATVGTEA